MKKEWKNSYWVRETFALLFNSTVPILGYNCVKRLRVIKIVKKSTFEGVLSNLGPEKKSQPFAKYLRLTLGFHGK